MQTPLITAIMVTGKPGREGLARLAIRSFRDQTYPNKHLLIVNDGIPTPPELLGPQITELRPSPGQRLGWLRNHALDNLPAGTEYVVQWDDDDYSHPSRLKVQLDTMDRLHASVMRYIVVCNITTGAMKVCLPTRKTGYGFAGTIMHKPTSIRYPNHPRGEDTEFIRALRRETQIGIYMNDQHPGLYVRTYHGLNTWSERHMMQFPPSGIKLKPVEQKRIAALIEDYRRARA